MGKVILGQMEKAEYWPLSVHVMKIWLQVIRYPSINNLLIFNKQSQVIHHINFIRRDPSHLPNPARNLPLYCVSTLYFLLTYRSSVFNFLRTRLKLFSLIARLKRIIKYSGKVLCLLDPIDFFHSREYNNQVLRYFHKMYQLK